MRTIYMPDTGWLVRVYRRGDSILIDRGEDSEEDDCVIEVESSAIADFIRCIQAAAKDKKGAKA